MNVINKVVALQAIIFVGNEHTFDAALSVLKKKNIDTCETLLIINSHEPAREIIERYVWFDIKYLFEDFGSGLFRKIKNRFSHVVWGIKARSCLEKIDTSQVKYFIAAHYDWVSHVSCYHAVKSCIKKFIIIDDGVKNIVLEHGRHAELSKSKSNILSMGAYSKRSLFERKIIEIVCKILNLKVDSVPILHWYTRLPIKSFSNHVKDKFVDLNMAPCVYYIDNDLVHFISQPLLGRDNFDENLFSKILFSIKNRFDEKTKIIYMPHRSENPLQTELASKFFVVGGRPNEPYEKFFSKMEKKPAAILSFYSSVLFTLHNESRASVKFYAIDCENVEIFFEENTKLVYNAMKNSGHIEMLKLKV